MSADGWTKPLQRLIDLGKAYDAGYPLPPLTLDIPAPYVLLPLKPLLEAKPFSLSPGEWEALVEGVYALRRSHGLVLKQCAKLMSCGRLSGKIHLYIRVPKGLLRLVEDSAESLEKAFQTQYSEVPVIRFMPR